MGLFGRFIKKDNKDVLTKGNSDRTVPKNEKSYRTAKTEIADAETGGNEFILEEHIQLLEKFEQQKVGEVCNTYIIKGIAAFALGSFDERALESLSFGEFCLVYNNIGWFVDKVGKEQVKKDAIKYKKFLRKWIFRRLSKMNTYVIYANVTNLPFVDNDSSLRLYVEKEAAQLVIDKSGMDWLKIQEITPQNFERYFAEFVCTGYKQVNLNGSIKAGLAEVCDVRPMEAYGNTCVEQCVGMVDYRQSQALRIMKAKEENREFNEEDVQWLSRQSWAVSKTLLECSLLLPAVVEDGKVISISTPLASFPDGSKYIGLFTDQFAIDTFFRQSTASVAVPNLIEDSYKKCENDDSVAGILINPGREEYKMTKEMLKQLLSK